MPTLSSCLHRTRLLAIAGCLGAGLLAHAGLTVQLVNDSGLPDSEVYAMLIGQPVASGGAIGVSGIPVANGSIVNNPAVESRPVSTLASAGFSIESTFSGRTLPVYEFTINSIASGAFLVSYQTNISYSNSNPSPITSNFRFDQCELTFDPSIVSVANLTSIDAYAVPMQLEVFAAPGESVPKARRTYYTSTEGLIAKFGSLGCSNAFYARGSSAPVRWTPSSGFGDFIRILGPGKISSNNKAGSPSPFPSFTNYLASLLPTPSTGYRFTVGGNANGSTYAYSGVVVSDNNGGYKVNLSGTTTPAPPSPVPANANMSVNLPNGNAPGAAQTVNFDSFIYGAVLDGASFSVAGLSASYINTNANMVYGAIARDVLSAINFGYLNGREGSSGLAWYGNPPTEYPFGLARVTNDGFYNPWAAVFYNESDAYGFAFSDRSGPSPAVSLQNNQILRITILPDRRLDSPKVTVAATNSTSLVLKWPAVPGATGYQLEVLSHEGQAPKTIPATPTNVTYTLSGLKSGTPYTFAVSATGTANGKPVRSPAIPHRASTSGALVQVNVPGGVTFDVSFSWAQNVPAGATATINGVVLTYEASKQQWLNNGVNAALSGVIGTNEYVVTVQDPAAGVIFANIMAVSFTGSPSSFGVGVRHLVGSPELLTEASPTGAAPYSPANPLTLGIPFVPDPTKAYTRVLFPAKTYAEWISGYPDVVNPDPASDPDLDGATSFLEYFRGSDPDHPDTSDFDRIGYDDASVLFSYKKSLVTVGVTELVQWSSDLQQWSTEGLTYGDDEDLGLVVRRTAQLPLPSDRPAFLRYTLNGP